MDLPMDFAPPSLTTTPTLTTRISSTHLAPTNKTLVSSLGIIHVMVTTTASAPSKQDHVACAPLAPSSTLLSTILIMSMFPDSLSLNYQFPLLGQVARLLNSSTTSDGFANIAFLLSPEKDVFSCIVAQEMKK